MLGQAKETKKHVFDHAIVTTFGKLDARDIEEIDGRPEQLVVMLMKHYGWSKTDSQEKADRLLARISK